MKGVAVYFWDFDGVILDSNNVRDFGFEEVLKDFDKNDVDKLMDFHQLNGGLSRYVKFRYFFEEVLGRSITDQGVQSLADEFSKIMLEQLSDSSLLIKESNELIKKMYEESSIMYIVSGSDQKELRFLCEKLGLSQFFKGIFGSPIAKTNHIDRIIEESNYDRNMCIMIGDSINDYEAAIDNNILFKGYNNKAIEKLTTVDFPIL